MMWILEKEFQSCEGEETYMPAFHLGRRLAMRVVVTFFQGANIINMQFISQSRAGECTGPTFNSHSLSVTRY